MLGDVEQLGSAAESMMSQLTGDRGQAPEFTDINHIIIDSSTAAAGPAEAGSPSSSGPQVFFLLFFLFQNSKDYIFLWFRCTLCYDIWKFLKKLVLTSLSLTCLTKIKLKQSNLVIQL